MIKRLLKTFFRRINFACINGLIFALTLVAVENLIKRGKKEKITGKTFIYRILFYSYSYVILHLTIVNRPKIQNVKFEKIFEGWKLVTDGFGINKYEAIGNIILFAPFIFLLLVNLSELVIAKKISKNKIIIGTLIGVFCISLCIECTQYIFSLGTFQVADLTYNTIGGVVGAVIYCCYKKDIVRK